MKVATINFQNLHLRDVYSCEMILWLVSSGSVANAQQYLKSKSTLAISDAREKTDLLT